VQIVPFYCHGKFLLGRIFWGYDFICARLMWKLYYIIPFTDDGDVDGRFGRRVGNNHMTCVHRFIIGRIYRLMESCVHRWNVRRGIRRRHILRRVSFGNIQVCKRALQAGDAEKEGKQFFHNGRRLKCSQKYNIISYGIIFFVSHTSVYVASCNLMCYFRLDKCLARRFLVYYSLHPLVIIPIFLFPLYFI